jgi:shikimate kinase
MIFGIRPVVITGFMAAGKTTLAAMLARRLNSIAIDLDSVISEREGRSVPALIDEKGELRFRDAETRALRAVLKMEMARVIALGGGAWTIAGNRELIADYDCLTVWLDAPFELCWQRIQSSGEIRPLARDLAAACTLYYERRALYALADLHVAASNEKNMERVVGQIARTV